jgi:Flp pilus assembly pilin Flp
MFMALRALKLFGKETDGLAAAEYSLAIGIAVVTAGVLFAGSGQSVSKIWQHQAGSAMQSASAASGSPAQSGSCLGDAHKNSRICGAQATLRQ